MYNCGGVSWPSRLWLQNKPIASLQIGMIPLKCVLDMTPNNLMVRVR